MKKSYGGDAEKAWVPALPGSFLGSWPDSDSHQTFLHPGVWVGNRDVSGQPDKIPAATMEGVANILLFERG